MKTAKIKLIKALIWFGLYITATILLFKIDWQIGLYVTIIGLAIFNSLKSNQQ